MSADAAGLEPRSNTIVGWIEAMGFVLCIGVIGVVYALAHAMGSHVVALMLYSMMLSGIALVLLIGRSGADAAIARAPISWLLGSANILVEAAYFLIVVWVTPAEASLLVRQALPWSLVAGAALFGLRAGWLSWVGAGMVAGAVGWLVVSLPGEQRWLALAFSALCALSFVTRSFASEFHPWNRAARTIRQKMQVTGVVTLVTALGGWALVGALMLAVNAGALPATPMLPRPADFAHAPTLIIAALVGAAIFTAMNYCAFSSVVKIGTDGFIAASTFTTPATLLVQYVAVWLGIIAPPVFGWALLPAMSLAIVGVLVFVWGQRRARA